MPKKIVQSLFSKIKYLQNHTGFMKYFKNTSWMFVEKIFRAITILFVGIWIARYLGPEQFGLLSYAMSFAGIFTVIATLGIDSIVIRELVKDEARSYELIGTAFYLKLIGAFITLIILSIAIILTSNHTNTNILIFIIASVVIFQSFNVVNIYFQAKILSKFAVYANIISLTISSIIKIVLILSQAPLVAFAWMVLFDSFILALGFIYFYLKNNLFIKNWKFNKNTAVKLLKDSWPLMLSTIAISIYMKIDQIMIKEILGNDAVGQYAAAVKLSEAWYFIPVVIGASLFPAIISAKKRNKELYHTRLQKLYDLIVWIAIAIALPMTFLSDWTVELLYGEQYNEAGGVLMIHIWSGVLVGLGIVRGKWQIAENFTKLYLYGSLIGACANIFLNYLLIPKYGIYGAAFATLIAQFLLIYVINYFFKELRGQIIFIHRIFNIKRLLK